ncbi:MAG: hypothetical protein ACRCU2_13315 [Planktothrix sp.]
MKVKFHHFHRLMLFVSIPLPGFNERILHYIHHSLHFRFNPVAGIHCNESWDEQVTMWTEEFITPSGTTRKKVFVQSGRTGNVPTSIGSLFVGCVAIPECRQIQAHVRRIAKLHETIFSPL